MSKILGRLKNAFNPKSRPQQLPPGTYPNNSGGPATLGTITKSPTPIDEDDDEFEPIGNYNVPQQTRLREQQRNTTPRPNNANPNWGLYGNNTPLPSTPLNPPPTSFRGPSSGFTPGLPMNQTINNNMFPSSNMNTGMASNPPPRAGFPFPGQIQNPTSTSMNNPPPPMGGFPPGMNLNPSAQPSTNNPPPPMGGFPPGMNPNPSMQPTTNNPQPPVGAFPPGMNPNQAGPSAPTNPPPAPFNPAGASSNPAQTSTTDGQSAIGKLFGGGGTNANQAPPPPPPPPPSGTTNSQPPLTGILKGVNSQQPQSTSNFPPNTQQASPTKPISSFNPNQSHDDDNVSRLELDYPVENVLVDANIPSAVAIKINEAVEQDRLGHAYHIHRYTFEPSAPQQISIGHNQHILRRVADNTQHGGTRYIREVHDDHQNPLNDSFNHHHHHSNRHHRQRHHNHPQSLEDYVEQLLLTPGSVVIHAQNSNNLPHLVNQQLVNSPMIPTQQFINPYPVDNNILSGPVFYYTARALPNDPMRHY